MSLASRSGAPMSVRSVRGGGTGVVRSSILARSSSSLPRYSFVGRIRPGQRRGVACRCSLPSNLQSLVGAFQMVPDPMARYKQLLFMAQKLPAMDDVHKVDQNKVEGCVSQVWVIVNLDEDGKLKLEADSDSQLTKGLAALLCKGLTGATPDEVVTLEPTFIEQLGLKQSLTPSRSNGFLNMFRLIQKKAANLA